MSLLCSSSNEIFTRRSSTLSLMTISTLCFLGLHHFEKLKLVWSRQIGLIEKPVKILLEFFGPQRPWNTVTPKPLTAHTIIGLKGVDDERSLRVFSFGKPHFPYPNIASIFSGNFTCTNLPSSRNFRIHPILLF